MEIIWKNCLYSTRITSKFCCRPPKSGKCCRGLWYSPPPSFDHFVACRLIRHDFGPFQTIELFAVNRPFGVRLHKTVHHKKSFVLNINLKRQKWNKVLYYNYWWPGYVLLWRYVQIGSYIEKWIKHVVTTWSY